ncbi:hypothetical protein NR798_28295 [Archangium gephyra]|uniref:hypothetical protein n=1 Tax=Archangium gephyra TaxID=48 RepID=UPI0035D4EDA5
MRSSAIDQRLRKFMTPERREETRRTLEQWRGACASLHEYSDYLKQLKIRLMRPGHLGEVLIDCRGCEFLSGPTGWQDAVLTLVERDVGPWELVDERVGFRVVCNLVLVHNQSEDPRLLERPELQSFFAELEGVRLVGLSAYVGRQVGVLEAMQGISGLLEIPHDDFSYEHRERPWEAPEAFARWLRGATKGLEIEQHCFIVASALSQKVGGTPWLQVELEQGLESLLPLWTKHRCTSVLVHSLSPSWILGVFQEDDRWPLYLQR